MLNTLNFVKIQANSVGGETSLTWQDNVHNNTHCPDLLSEITNKIGTNVSYYCFPYETLTNYLFEDK